MSKLNLPAPQSRITPDEEQTLAPRIVTASALGTLLQQTKEDLATEAEEQRRQQEALLRQHKRETYRYD